MMPQFLQPPSHLYMTYSEYCVFVCWFVKQMSKTLAHHIEIVSNIDGSSLAISIEIAHAFAF